MLKYLNAEMLSDLEGHGKIQKYPSAFFCNSDKFWSYLSFHVSLVSVLVVLEAETAFSVLFT